MLKVKTVEDYFNNREEDALFERWKSFSDGADGTFRSAFRERSEVDAVFKRDVEAFTTRSDQIIETLYNSITAFLIDIQARVDEMRLDQSSLSSYKKVIEQVLLTIQALDKGAFLISRDDLYKDLIEHRKLFHHEEYGKEFNKAVRESFSTHNIISFETLLTLHKKGLIDKEIIQEIVDADELYEANELGIIDDEELVAFITREAMEKPPKSYPGITAKIIKIYNANNDKHNKQVIIQKMPGILLAAYFTIQEDAEKRRYDL